MLPKAFKTRMETYLGEGFGSFLDCYEAPPSLGLRVNTLKVSPQAFSEISPFSLTPVPWTDVGFTLPAEARPGTHPYHAAGLFYLQDPAAMAVTELLDPQPGEVILDLAAAPGGKTTHIAARMNQDGLLVANDINTNRVRDLCNNLERWGARNTVVLNETPQRLAAHFGPYFDKVLVDAPCSGEGMFRKDPKAVYEWSPRMIDSCANRQVLILAEAARLVRSGGRLVYATCTFAPEENEGSVMRFLEAHPNFRLENVDHIEGLSRGCPEWLPEVRVSDSGLADVLRQTVRLWPHLGPGEGHFIAVMRKITEDHARNMAPIPFQYFPMGADSSVIFNRFVSETLKYFPDINDLSLHGNYLYRIPPGIPDLHGLRVVHWGWWLGMLKSNRFEPAQALVMALSPEDVQQVYNLDSRDNNLERYLRGEVLAETGADGWVMVSVDGYPLGWAKRVQNRLKPRFPNWLRKIG